MSDRKYAYISCVNIDTEFVKYLTDNLSKNGFYIMGGKYVFTKNKNIGDDNEFDIKNADALIPVISLAYSKSPLVISDVMLFLRQNKPIIPILVSKDVLPESLLIIFRDFCGIVFDDSNAAFQIFVERLISFLNESEPIVEENHSSNYVFISYAEEDLEFVEELRDYLSNQGYKYWDYKDSYRDYQKQLHQELEKIIDGAIATICIISPAWKNSKWTAKEYLYSEEKGTPIFLLYIEETEPMLITSGRTYIDCTNRVDFEELCTELKKLRTEK